MFNSVFNFYQRIYLILVSRKPTQHGEDLVGLISSIINENALLDSKTNIVLVCLSVEALQSLGSAQVLDLASTWNVIKSKLERNGHPFVLRSLCDFFSVVPSVAADSQGYEEFKASSLTFLWQNVFHGNVIVSAAAFSALSKFCPADFQIRYLPNKVRHSIIERLKNSPKIKRMMEERDDEEDEIDFGSFSLPGYFYIDLLKQIPTDVHQAYTTFLNNVVRDEVSRIPRGLSHKVMKRQETVENKIMASVPVLLQTQYDKCKQASLKPNIAASLLFCNELKVERRDGKQIRSNIVSNAKKYRNMLNNLLHEVPVQSSEGPRNVDTCLAWTIFMMRVFDSSIEGRKTELVMQEDRGHINEEELNFGLQNAWLWVRDLLSDQLKTASKGSHVMQGNSLFALAGLANAVFRYRSTIEHGQEVTQPRAGEEAEHQHMAEWIAAAVDTLLVVLDGNVKTFGIPMDWCQQVSSVTSSASSVLARSCAALALSQIVPALLAEDFDRIQQIIQVLHARIPGQTKAGSSSVIQSHCSLGMGLVLKQLYHENFSNYFGQEGYLLLAKGLDALETAAFSSELANTEGAIYALGSAMTSLCRETSVAIRVHGKTTYQRMIEFYEKQKNGNGSKLQVSSLALAFATVNFFETELLNSESVLKTILNVEKRVENVPQDRDLASAFGLLVHGLRSIGEISVEQLSLKWEKHWRSLISDNSLSTSLRVAALSGLAALYGSEQTLLKLENPNANVKSYLENGVKIFTQLLHSSKDVTLIGNILWYLGRFSLSNKAFLSTQSTLPDNLDYLGEDSVLNCLVHLLIEFEKAGTSISSELIEILNTALRVLAEGPKDPLPPLNWLNVLYSLIKHSFGNRTTESCLNLALSSTSPNATGTFLSSWLSPSVWIALETNCKIQLCSSLDQLVRILSPKKSKEFIENAAKLFSENEINIPLAEAFLTGLCSVLRMPDTLKSIMPHVKETIENIYCLLPNNFKQEYQTVYRNLGDCLHYFPSEEAEKLTEPQKESVVKSLTIRKQLFLHNKTFSWKLVKPCADLALSTDISFDVLPPIVSAISCLDVKDLDDISVEWTMKLLNSIGIINNVESTNAVLLVLTVLSLTTNKKDDILVALALTNQDRFLDESSPQDRDNYKQWLYTIKYYLPETFPDLLEKTEWKGLVEKVIDKLLTLHQLCDPESSRLILEISLELRRFDVYKKRSIWTQVVSFV